MATDALTARREIAWLDAGLEQREELRNMLRVAAAMAMDLARTSRDDVAAIRRTYEHLLARFDDRPTELSPDDALIALSVVFSALKFPDDANAIHAYEARASEQADLEQRFAAQPPPPNGFPSLFFHKPPLVANKTFPGVLLCKPTE